MSVPAVLPLWREDVLGSRFARLELPLASDDEGPVVATLVRHGGSGGVPAPVTAHAGLPPGAGPWPRVRSALRRFFDPDGHRAPAGQAAAGQGSHVPDIRAPEKVVLYLHGWADYFLQAELADHVVASGFHFYALDLRKFGRSLRDWQTPGYTTDLAVYDEDIAAALAEIGSDIAARTGSTVAPTVHLLAHSLGGLVAALWADRNPGRLGTLILNAPWLELQGSSLIRNIAMHFVEPLARTDPHRALLLPAMPGYWDSVSGTAHGEWDVDPVWRPKESFPVRPGWTKAVMAGHAAVAQRLDIKSPVLVMLSGRTRIQAEWSEELMGLDAVIDVEETARSALGLGRRAAVFRYPGALHDVFLSRRAVRREAYDDLVLWLSLYPG
ncbi:alpha/beta hydrolase [Arthrobacter sp. U41]|uniref:alpha/beta hydrolase n=1 Tax=Arthrobacter sp. U41 TaxID=1849032 RepID=UPI00085947B3|nr:alpha/beta hydrolase [Arthrobacter sp. U41]AOT04628.1 lysophospholipase [Arthrobacter sp. U41]